MARYILIGLATSTSGVVQLEGHSGGEDCRIWDIDEGREDHWQTLDLGRDRGLWGVV